MKRLMQAQVVLSTIVVYFHNRATVHQLSKDFTRETGQLITMIQSDLAVAGEAEQRQNSGTPMGSNGATHPFIPLDVLTRAHDRTHSCPEGLLPAFSNPIPYDNSTNTKIPLVIHQTFRDNCLSEDFHNLHTRWRDLGVPYYFHSDQEIERLVISGTFEEFPQLPAIWKACITKPVVKTDFWRLLLLYEYGGIYTDLDTAPNQFRPQTHIKPEDEMYTVTDGHGCPSFHFMAAMPRHPFVFLMLQQGMMELLVMPDTGKYNPAVRTGPGALKNAMAHFLWGTDKDKTQIANLCANGPFLFTGTGGHTVRREGFRTAKNKIVNGNALDNAKKAKFGKMNMTHYSDPKALRVKTYESCFEAIMKYGESVRLASSSSAVQAEVS